MPDDERPDPRLHPTPDLQTSASSYSFTMRLTLRQ
jgi:hypothetical protein